MVAVNDFLPFGNAVGANVTSQAAYLALATRTAGFATGLADAEPANKAWRQTSLITSMLAQFMADTLSTHIVDDGTTANLEVQLQQAMLQFTMAASYGLDTSLAANIITVALTPPILSYFPGLRLYVKLNTTNTSGVVSINVNGLGNKLIQTPSGSNLQIGALLTGAIVRLIYDGTVFRTIGEARFGTNQSFITSNGTFIVPPGVTLLKAAGLAGGGGASGSSTTGGGAGGGGGEYREGLFQVTPGQNIVMTIGQGGPGGLAFSGSPSSGITGGTTSFGALFSCIGGSPGSMVAASTASGGGGGSGGSGGLIDVPGSSGGDGGPYPGYGGWGGIYGSSTRAGTFPTPSSGNSFGWGSGGSGSYNFVAGGGAVGGGAGLQGFLMVEW